MRMSCKRHARELVLAYYAELSSNIDIVLEWSQQNSALIPANAAGKKDRLIKLYHKAKIADLTGVENQERKAKFIYDLSKLVSCLQLFDDAALDTSAPLPAAPVDEPEPQVEYGSSHTVIASLPPKDPAKDTSMDFTPKLPALPESSIHPSRRTAKPSVLDTDHLPSTILSVSPDGVNPANQSSVPSTSPSEVDPSNASTQINQGTSASEPSPQKPQSKETA